MEKVTGIGGVFFRARDPEALARWYRDHVGIPLIPTSNGERPWLTQAGPTAFAPFPQDTTYFGDPGKMWMLNFRVSNLEAMASQLRAGGIPVEIDSQVYPYGRFARLHDPEGNPIELWEPREQTPPG
ncbi:MAG TPA: VOC family protein [Terriglobales bacterium]|nr:VOC family protein [Terriglobales bacterium]